MSDREILRTTTRSLPVKLLDRELLAIGGELAATNQDITMEEDRQNDIKTQMKARLTELQARQTQLTLKIVRREEYREVEVEERITAAVESCRSQSPSLVG